MIAVIEMSQSKWLVAAVVPGVKRQPLKKLQADEEALLPSTSGSGSRRISTPSSYGTSFTRSRWGTRGAPGSRFFLSS